MYFQLCQGALEPLCCRQVMPPVTIRPHYLPVLHGLKRSAMGTVSPCDTQMNHFTDKRSTENQRPPSSRHRGLLLWYMELAGQHSH